MKTVTILTAALQLPFIVPESEVQDFVDRIAVAMRSGDFLAGGKGANKFLLRGTSINGVIINDVVKSTSDQMLEILKKSTESEGDNWKKDA